MDNSLCENPAMIFGGNTLPQVVEGYAETQPDKIAVVANDKPVTYAQLKDLVAACKASLHRAGTQKGDCIAISAVMKVEYVAAFLAVKFLRAVVVPINKTAGTDEAADIVKRVNAKVFLTDNPRYRGIVGYLSLSASCKGNEESRPGDGEDSVSGDIGLPVSSQEKIPAREITEILFTSGTTGRPKGAMLSQSGIAASIKNTATGMDMKPDDVLLVPLPLNHSFGLRVLRAALYQGETIVLQNGFTFANETVGNLEKWKCNCMVAVNAGFEMLLQQLGDRYRQLFGKMRYIEFSAGPVPVERRRELAETLPGVRLYNTWGSTETGGGLFLEFSAEKEKIESAGRPINDIEAAIIDDDGQMVPDGTYGRLALRSGAVLAGYFDDLELTAQTLCGGWLRTNDLARKDQDGYVYLKGRVDDIISVGGEKIAPGDIEKLICQLDFVKECACVGVEDPKGVLGQIPVVFWVAGEEMDRAEWRIREQVLKNRGSLMVPQQLIKVDELPRNYMGKLDKQRMKELCSDLMNEEKDRKDCDKKGFVEELKHLILTRRSVRAFQEKIVEREKLDNILLAGRMAPSGHNMQTWRFTVIADQKEIGFVRDTTEIVAKREQTSFYGFNNPSAIIIASNDRRNDDAAADTSAAIENMLLMAHAQGLGACWINSWIKICDQPEIRRLMNKYDIPKMHIVYGIVGIGYAAAPVKMPVKKEDVVRFYEENKKGERKCERL